MARTHLAQLFSFKYAHGNEKSALEEICVEMKSKYKEKLPLGGSFSVCTKRDGFVYILRKNVLTSTTYR